METIQIGSRPVGPGHSVYIVAEISANHGQKFEQAVEIIHAARKAGADAVKLQTYTPDTMTIRGDSDLLRINGGTLWDGRTLHELYSEAYMPWEWQPKLKQVANEAGLELFSSPFDGSAVDFLERMEVPAYKIASFEIVDLPLIKRIAQTGKPLIISTGMATFEEIQEALTTARGAGATQIALLKCTSAYPAPADEMNLRTLPELARRFQVPVGLSDHMIGITAPIAAVALGASIIEKHITLSRSIKGPDSEFSLEPQEFGQMVEAVRSTERALGKVQFGPGVNESKCRIFRRSLFVVEDLKQGQVFDEGNVRSIRPAHGLHTRHLGEVLGKHASRDIEGGTPLSWDLVANK